MTTGRPRNAPGSGGFPRSLPWLCGLLGGALLLLATESSRAAQTRTELAFQLQAALLAHNKVALAQCFNWQGVDGATRRTYEGILADIYRWPTQHIFTSERKEGAPREFEQGGRRFGFNGEWQFQVHVYLSQKTSKGYVFPAGTAPNGQVLVLLPVPVPTPATPANRKTP